jgi:hypothetical protein
VRRAVARTRLFDDYLLAAAADGIRQVVLPAAGLDARAFRLQWPDGVRLCELDLPEVLTFQDRVLTECSAWLAEGLLLYLTAHEAATLLTRIDALSRAGSRLAVQVATLGTNVMRAEARKAAAMQAYAELWKGGLPDASRSSPTSPWCAAMWCGAVPGRSPRRTCCSPSRSSRRRRRQPIGSRSRRSPAEVGIAAYWRVERAQLAPATLVGSRPG